ncbi:MAG TPA: hypothetical protein ENN80_12705 [Candidatus Hydrogenedentes bacterium]|nr:hypothetical protein [Candidatus Hydrogenedentota bacterium]
MFPYAIGVLVAVMASTGHMFFKRFALKRRFVFPHSLFDPHLDAGLFLFGSSVILTLIAVHYLDFSVYYSLTALNYVFISALSKVYLGERIDRQKIIGNAVIILGIVVYNLHG